MSDGKTTKKTTGSTMLGVRCTREELTEYKAIAKSYGLGLSSFVRMIFARIKNGSLKI